MWLAGTKALWTIFCWFPDAFTGSKAARLKLVLPKDAAVASGCLIHCTTAVDPSLFQSCFLLCTCACVNTLVLEVDGNLGSVWTQRPSLNYNLGWDAPSFIPFICKHCLICWPFPEFKEIRVIGNKFWVNFMVWVLITFFWDSHPGVLSRVIRFYFLECLTTPFHRTLLGLICLFIWEAKRQKNQSSLNPIYSLNAHNSWDWAKPKPRAGKLNPGLLHERQVLNHLSHHFCLPGSALTGCRGQEQSQAFWHGISVVFMCALPLGQMPPLL